MINQIRQNFNLQRIGDDCAVLPKNKKRDLIITSDLMIEDIDFRRRWMIPKYLGHKSLAVSLSDIAAMGGKPLFALLSIGLPEDIWPTNLIKEFYEGYFELAKKFGVELIGGDISKTPDKIVIDSIVLGETGRNKAVLRSTAHVGDLIFVTGKLGGASLGLKLLEENTAGFEEFKLLQLKPNPRIEAGQFLSRIATSMIDISDGLSSDLHHLCESSKVGAKLYADKIPKLESDRWNLEDALHGGEDFELLFTVNPKKKIRQNFDSFFCIGEMTANIGIIELIKDEKATILEPKGFQHF